MTQSIAERWQLPEPLADAVAGVGPEVVFFGDTDEATAEALVTTAERWRARYGERAAWRDDGSGRWRKAGKTFWAAALRKIAGFSDPRPHAFGVICDPFDRAPTGPAIELFAADGMYVLRWVADREEDEPTFREDLDWLAREVPCRWGYAGAGVYGAAYGDATGGRVDEVGHALQRWPLLGMSHPVLWGVPEEGVACIGWCTLLGAQLPSRPGLRSSKGIAVRSVGEATIAELDIPPLAEEVPGAARQLWKKLGALRAPEAARTEGWIPGLSLDDMSAWACRFD